MFFWTLFLLTTVAVFGIGFVVEAFFWAALVMFLVWAVGSAIDAATRHTLSDGIRRLGRRK